MTTAQMMTPAETEYYTAAEVHRWLTQLAVRDHDTGKLPRLPRAGQVLIVQSPAPFFGTWRVVRHASGYAIERD